MRVSCEDAERLISWFLLQFDRNDEVLKMKDETKRLTV